MLTTIVKVQPSAENAYVTLWCSDCGSAIPYEMSFAVKKDGHAVAYVCAKDAEKRKAALAARRS